MRLVDLQRNFFDAVRAAEEPSAGDAAVGMRIYRNNYREQLAATLRDSFAHVRLWLGEDAFDAAADAQILQSPPSSWTLDDYGRDFPALLRKLYPDDAEVAELAWLDLVMSQAFVTADTIPIGPQELAGVRWESARIHFGPLHLSEAATNAAEIWHALERGTMPPAAQQLPQRAGYLVWRSGFTPLFRRAELREYRLLSRLYLGAAFGQACSAIEAETSAEEAVGVIGEILGRWLSDGLVAGVAYAPAAAA